MMLSVVKKGILRNTWSNPVIFCSLRTQSKKKNVEDLQFDNVIEATGPHNHVNFVHQRRKMMPDRVKGFKKIVLRERDTEPVLYPTLEQRLIELDPVLRDPILHKKVNIGMKYAEKESASQQRRRKRDHIKLLKKDKDLLNKAFHHELEIDMDAVSKEYLTDALPRHTRDLANHCGIFKDLFGPYAYFDPIVPLKVTYDCNEEEVSPVCRGNIIKPSEARGQPNVHFPSRPDTLWTLLLTNPDGNLYEKEAECVHWLVTNIKGGDVSTGTEVVPCLPPFPPKGVGYQRCVFVLFRQEGAIEHSHELSSVTDLKSRTFSTEQFYRTHETCITPAGLVWYNTDWDVSMSDFFSHTLQMKEPIYEYDMPKNFIAPEQHWPASDWFDHVVSFTNYTDKYRPAHEHQELMLKERLRTLHPFQTETPRLPYPDAPYISHEHPSWYRQQIEQKRKGWGRNRELYRNDYLVDSRKDPALLERAATVEVERGHTVMQDEAYRQNTMTFMRKALPYKARVFQERERERLSRVKMADLTKKHAGDVRIHDKDFTDY